MDDNYIETDPSPLASLQQNLMNELDKMDAETYAMFLSTGELPSLSDS